MVPDSKINSKVFTDFYINTYTLESINRVQSQKVIRKIRRRPILPV